MTRLEVSQSHRRRAVLALASLSLATVASLGAGCDHDSLSPGGPGLLHLGGRGEALGLAVLADGRSLVSGTYVPPGPADAGAAPALAGQVLLARFDASGHLDRTFGAGGAVTSPGTVISAATSGGSPVALSGNAVAVDSVGHILVAGRYWADGHGDKFLLARYSSEGVLDGTFGAAGMVWIDPNPNFVIAQEGSGEAKAIAIQPDGKILLGGFVAVNHALTGQVWSDYAVVRLLPNGTPDATFGKNGAVVTSFGSSAFIASMALLADGRILVAGYAAPGPTYDLALVRYLPSGQLDPGFGVAGKAVVDLGANERVFALTLDPARNAYVVAGDSAADADGKLTRFLVARFSDAGVIDPTFGTGGSVITDFGTGVSSARGVLRSGTGYLASGWAVGSSATSDFAFATFDGSGAPLDCAGDNKRFTLSVNPIADDSISAMAAQLDGSPIVVGKSGDSLAFDWLPSLTCAVRTRVQ